jgi:ligand-binding sensor domain-containing protein
MKHKLMERAQSLCRHLPPKTSDTLDACQNLLPDFRRTRKERSPVWFVTTASAVLIIVVLVAVVWIGYHIFRELGWIPIEPVQEMGDARWGEDYRKYTATDWAVVDDNNLVITTQDGGAYHCRLDGGLRGIWETFDPKRTAGLLSSVNLRQVHYDGRRLWFVGEMGSLSSCNRKFRDWKLHFGGGGFAPGLDLSTQMTCLAISSDQTVYVVGTHDHGLGIYDVVTRQWQSFNPIQGNLYADHVTTVLLRGQWLWVGTEKGLNVFRLRRQNSLLRVHPEPRRELPQKFSGRLVRALSWVGDSRRGYVQCIVGRGANLEADASTGRWRVLVDEGDEHLADMNGPAAVSSLLPASRGAWLALPQYGLAFYDAVSRRLTLRNEGLPTRFGGYTSPVTVQSSNPADIKSPIWTVCRESEWSLGRLYRREKSEWQLVSPDEDNVVELKFVGQKPLVRLENGTVRLYQLASEQDSSIPTFFQSNHFGSNFGPAEVGDNQFFLGTSNSDVSNQVAACYLPALRSWQPLTSNNAVPFRQFRSGTNALWSVKQNGEAGYFAPLNTPSPPEYKPVMGPSDLPEQPGQIVTAEAFKNNFWFVRKETDGNYRTYVYDSARRSIHVKSEGIDEKFIPRQLRAAGQSILYLWGSQEGRGIIYSCAGENSWQQINHGEADIVQMVTTADGMLCRSASGEVFVHPTKESSLTILLKGTGYLRWRRLAPDRFGRLWGVSEEGAAAYYHRTMGNWVTLLDDGSATDIIVTTVDKMTDKVFVGTTDGLWVWKSTATEEKKAEKPELPDERIQKLDFDGRRIWALTETGDPKKRSVWTRKPSGGDWRKIWETTITSEAPRPEDWDKAIWVDCVKDELWWVTTEGRLWRYGIQTPFWTQWNMSEEQPQNLQMSKPGVFWWLEQSGTLHAAEPKKEETAVAFDGCPDYHSWWENLSTGITWFMWGAIVLGGVLFLLVCVFLFGPPLVTLLAMIFYLLPKRPPSDREYLEEDNRREPERRTPYWQGVKWCTIVKLGFLLLALLLYGCNQFITRQLIAPYQPFLGKHFDGKVLDFAVDGRELKVRTDEGTWIFKCKKGVNTSPELFLPGERRELSPAKLSYPRMDQTGLWQIKRSDNTDFSLWRKNKSGTFQACHFREGRMAGDDISIAAVGNTLLVSTPVGLAEYKARKNLRLSRLTPLPQYTPGILARQANTIYYWSPDGPVYRYTGVSQKPWAEAPSTWPRIAEAHGVRWRNTPQGDEFVQPDFNLDTRCFLADLCVRLAKDEKDSFWLQTKAGWRQGGIDGEYIHLTEPRSNPPQEASPTKQWAATSTWDCQRNSMQEGTDSVTFIFSSSGHRAIVVEPFGTRGRWPDEDVHAVLPDGDVSWIGTAYGLRQRDSKGQEIITLAGRQVSAISRRGNSLFCRTDGGDYVLDGQIWKRVTEAPQDTFPATRTLHLPLGKDVVITATERTSDAHTTTELASFDAQQRRFYHDVIQEMEWEADGFWALTPAGIQRFWVAQNQISKHRADLVGQRLIALRRGMDRILYATDGQLAWRYQDDADWQQVTNKDYSNPFTVPPRGALSKVVHWERRFAPGGDSYQLWTDRALLTFVEGKLASDYISGATGFGLQRWQATPAGIITDHVRGKANTKKVLIPWPESLSGTATLPIAVDKEQLVCRLPDGAYGYDADHQRWHPVNTTVFDVPEAQFDGHRWSVQYAAAEGSRIRFRPSEGDEWQIKLNNWGQFPFDSVHSVTNRSGELWISHGTGVAVYPMDSPQSEPFSPVRYLHAPQCWPGLNQEWKAKLSADSEGRIWLALLGSPVEYRVYDEGGYSRPPLEHEKELIPFLRSPQWSGNVNGVFVTVGATPSRDAVEIVGAPEPLPLQETALYITRIGPTVWVLTTHGLKALSPEVLKRRG